MEDMTRVTMRVLTIEPRTERGDWGRGARLLLELREVPVAAKKRGGEA